MSAPILLPYQRSWVQDKAQLKVVQKSRRIGLSWCEAYDAVMHAGSGAGDVYYQTYSLDGARGFISDCGEWAKGVEAAADEYGEVLLDLGERDKNGRTLTHPAYRIPMASGREIFAMTSHPRVFRSKGRPGDLGIIDEAAFMDQLDEAIKSALAFQMWGGRVHIISTHNTDSSPFAALCNDIAAGLKPGSLHTITFDDAVSQGLYEVIARVTRNDFGGKEAWVKAIRDSYGSDAEEELDCIPKASLEAWLKWAVIRQCEDEEAGDPAGYTGGPVYVGIDVARKYNLWCAEVLEEVDNVLWTREEVILEDVRFSVHTGEVQRIFNDYRVVQLFADATGMGMPVVEGWQDKWGSRVEGVTFTPAARVNAATALREAMEDRELRTPANRVELRNDLRLPQAAGDPGQPTRIVVPPAKKKGESHADRFWALGLAVLAARQGAYAGVGETTGDTWEATELGTDSGFTLGGLSGYH